MKKKVWLILYGLVMLVFVGWMIGATPLLIRLNGAVAPQAIDFETVKGYMAGDPLYWSLDAVQVMNDAMEDFSFAGWAFVETDEDNPDRYTSLILKGESVSYEMPILDVIPRPDLITTFPSRRIRSENTGFGAMYTTLRMRDGVYEIYLYCRENDVNYGMVHTGFVLEKRGRRLSYAGWRSRPTKLSAAPGGADTAYAVDNISMRNQWLSITGWAFVPGATGSQTVYVSLTNEDGKALQYTTKNVARADVAMVFDNPDCATCGFDTHIPMEEIEDGVWTVRVLVKHPGGVAASGTIYLEKSGEAIEWAKE